jgi:MFS family permease
MMGGLLITSILSGQLIARTGRYRIFPIVGTGVMVIGLGLLSRLDVGTSTATSALYLLVLGVGLGLVMQVLVLAVQNAVDYQVLGAATSGVTLFRGVGGSLGAAVFGTIFSSRLTSGLSSGLPAAMAHQVAGGGRLTGSQVARLPPAARSAYEHAYVHALRPVFVAAAGVALLGALLAWLLPDRPLRETAATSRGLEDSLAVPRAPDSLAEIERALSCAVTAEQRQRFRKRLVERAGIDLSPGATWALVRIGEYGTTRARSIAEGDGVPPDRIAAVIEELRERGLIAGDGAGLTADGRSQAQRVLTARRTLLDEALADEHAQRDPAVDELLHRLARQLAGEPPVDTAAPATAGAAAAAG